MLDSGWHSDIALAAESENIAAHSLIIKARASKFYKNITENTENMTQDNGLQNIRVPGVEAATLKNYLRYFNSTGLV